MVRGGPKNEVREVTQSKQSIMFGLKLFWAMSRLQHFMANNYHFSGSGSMNHYVVVYW